MDIVGLLSFIFVITLLGFFMYQTFRLTILSKQLKDELLQSYLDKDLVLKKLDQEINKVSPVEQTEGFVRFLSQSREAAFGYIEDVQKALLEFTSKVSPDIEYYQTYGTVIDSPHKAIMDRFIKAYDELLTVLPEENKEK